MTDNNTTQTDALRTEVTTVDTNAMPWTLAALTEALGDLTLTVNDSLSIGRGSDNDVVLGSKEVSRNHALLSVLNGQLYVKDLNSSNGTFINEVRIEGNKSKSLEAHDTLGFASFNFRVVTAIDTDISNGTAIEPVDIEPAAPLNPVESDAGEPTILTGDALVENTAPESVIKETIIGDVLSAAAGLTVASTALTESEITTATPVTEQQTLSSKDKSTEVLTGETVMEHSHSHAASLSAATVDSELEQNNDEHKVPVVSPEHDKTTLTALQEEADPDVLRAKQAATSQFSGTANLGQSRDVGTEGNNAMDQAINNTAHSGQVDKKPSGGWFIWVFLAILIIGVVVWWLNKGGL